MINCNGLTNFNFNANFFTTPSKIKSKRNSFSHVFFHSLKQTLSKIEPITCSKIIFSKKAFMQKTVNCFAMQIS